MISTNTTLLALLPGSALFGIGVGLVGAVVVLASRQRRAITRAEAAKAEAQIAEIIATMKKDG